MYNFIRRHRRPDNRDQAAKELSELVANALKGAVATGLAVSGFMMGEGMEMDVYALGEQPSEEAETPSETPPVTDETSESSHDSPTVVITDQTEEVIPDSIETEIIEEEPSAPTSTPITDPDATPVVNSPATSEPDQAQVSIADPITEPVIDSAPSNDSSPAQAPEINTETPSELNSTPTSSTAIQEPNSVPNATSAPSTHMQVSKAPLFPTVKSTTYFTQDEELEGNVRDTLNSIEEIAEDFDVLTHEAEINTDLNANIKTDIYSSENAPILGESEDFVATGEEANTRIEIGSIKEGNTEIIVGSTMDNFGTAQQVESTVVLDTDIQTDTITKIEVNGQPLLEDGKLIEDETTDGMLTWQPLGKDAALDKLTVISEEAENLRAITSENYRTTVIKDSEGTKISTDQYFQRVAGGHEYSVVNIAPEAIAADNPTAEGSTTSTIAALPDNLHIVKRGGEKLLINIAYKPETSQINLGGFAIHEDNGFNYRGKIDLANDYNASLQNNAITSKELRRKLSDLSKEIIINFGGYNGRITTSGNFIGTLIAPNAEFVGTQSGLGKLLVNKFTNNGGWIGNGVGKQAEQTPAPGTQEDDEKPADITDDKKPEIGDKTPADDKNHPETDDESDPTDADKKPSEAEIQPQTETTDKSGETLGSKENTDFEPTNTQTPDDSETHQGSTNPVSQQDESSHDFDVQQAKDVPLPTPIIDRPEAPISRARVNTLPDTEPALALVNEALDQTLGKVLDAMRNMESDSTHTGENEAAKTSVRISDASTLDADRSRNAATGDTATLPHGQVAASIAVAGLIGYAGVSLRRPYKPRNK